MHKVRTDVLYKTEDQLTFPGAICSPHEARTEAVRPVRLFATRTVIRIRPAAKARQLSALDPIESRVKRDFIRDQHALERTSVRVPHCVHLRSTGIVALEAACRILHPQHGTRRGVAAGGWRIWEWISNKDEIGCTVLDAAFGEIPIGSDERLGTGIVENFIGKRNCRSGRQLILGRNRRRGSGLGDSLCCKENWRKECKPAHRSSRAMGKDNLSVDLDCAFYINKE
jgi:hypothetical protein